MPTTPLVAHASLPRGPSRNLFAATLGVLMGLSTAGCTDPAPAARAYRVTSRAQLIGGPNALGEVGDFLLENDKIRVIIQDEGFSRGFGVFGGSLIDADLVRPGTGPGTSNEGGGRDNFGELFPSFFLEALAPSEVFDPDDPAGQRKLAAIEVTGDGRDGATAEVTVRGYGGDFLSLTQTINEFLLDDPREAPNLLFTTKYRLAPGRRYVEIVTTVHNVAFPERDLTLPNDLLGITVPSPFGDVLLFGAGNKVFLPHEAGFDTRFRLEAVYQAQNITLPALPGLAAEFIASAGPDVSYGLLAASPSDPELNFAYHNREFFPDATPHSLHVPFLASAFTGVFQVLPPPVLAANDGAAGGADEYSFTRYFIVGSGDVASVSDVVHDLLGTETGSIEGQVRDADGGQGVKGVSLVVTDPTGKKVTQLYSDDGGRFRARLPAGDYAVVLLKEGREATAPAGFSVKTGERTFVPLTLPGAARLVVTVIEPGVGPVPAKVSLVGTAPEETIGTDPRAWLFDLSLGERYRYTDFEPDTDEPSTRRYLEDFTYTEEGVATLKSRPGRYSVIVTRGPEYERVELPDVEISPGSTRTLSASIRRVVDTEGYIAADFHLHSIYSLDSFANLEDRVTSYAGEGLELVVATDHNYVVDYGPTIGKLGLERFVHSLVGLELTTIDRGHFNGFPLRRGNGALAGDGTGRYENTIASRTFGSFQWAERTPQQIFDSLRALAPKDPACLSVNRNDPSICPDEVDRVIVQVNHPRDSILGYFDQYVLDQESLEVKGQSGLIGANTEQRPEYAASEFSWDFDALEVFNGKRFELLHNYVVPAGLPEDPVLGRPLDPVSCCPLTPGEVVREYPAFDCDDTLRDCTCTTADAEAQLAAGRCEGGEILHPGVVEDWFQLLRAGRRVVGTANSDSHEPDAEEPGYPRSYVRVSDDNPRQVTGQDIVAGFLAGDVLMTNGPFVQVIATSGTSSVGMGETLTVAAGQVHITVEVRHAPWVLPNRARLYHDGIIVAEASLTPDGSGILPAEFDVDVTRDGFLVIEVTGDDNMFPSVYPQEVPSLQFTDVIGALGDSFGFLGGSGLQPTLTYQVTPYALTNPIYLDGDGDGTVTPQLTLTGVSNLEARAPTATVVSPPTASLGDPPLLDARPPWQRYRDALPARKRRALEQRLPEWLWPTDHPKDIRRVFAQFARHAH